MTNLSLRTVFLLMHSETMAKACNGNQPDGLPVAVSLWAVARHCLLHVDISAELEVVGDDLLV